MLNTFECRGKKIKKNEYIQIRLRSQPWHAVTVSLTMQKMIK